MGWLALRKILGIIGILLVLLAAGTAGFMAIEGWGFLDALFMAVITMTTVGYGEVHPLSEAGRIFVIGYLIVGFGAFSYGVIKIAEMVLQAHFREWMEKRKMETALRSMKDHFIICGFGRMGQALCKHLSDKGRPFVAIDRDEAALAAGCQEGGWVWLAGDATDDRTLQEAGIDRAAALAAVLPSEADNLYVVLSARLLSRSIRIIARATDEKGIAKLEKAGANRVVSLYGAGAAKMAQLLSNPNVEEFLEVISSRGKELGLTEIQVRPESSYAGIPLAQTAFRRMGIIIVGIRRDGQLLLPPESTEVIRSGDLLIALGRADSISDLCRKA